MAVAKINIELHYDLDGHYGSDVHENMDAKDILNDLEDTVYEDLIDLMRGDRLWSFCEIEIDKDMSLVS
jgi:hypothetical protein